MSGLSHAEPQINATPLIDVMLVLLVTMIMTLPVATHAVKLNLPQAPGATPPQSIRVDITYGGDIFWNGEHLESLAQLARRFAVVAGAATQPRVNVIPEKRTRYEIVVQVLALAQRSNVTSLSVAPVADNAASGGS
jgi:biopolymer transport protein ExbD